MLRKLLIWVLALALPLQALAAMAALPCGVATPGPHGLQAPAAMAAPQASTRATAITSEHHASAWADDGVLSVPDNGCHAGCTAAMPVAPPAPSVAPGLAGMAPDASTVAAAPPMADGRLERPPRHVR